MKASMLFVSLLASTGFMFTSAPAVAGDACKNVKFKFVNSHKSGQPIRLEQVKYRNTDNNAQQTEQVPSFVCDNGKTCVTPGDDLRDSEGVDLVNIRFVYRVQQIKNGKVDWGNQITSGPNDPSDPKCKADKTYGAFSING